MTYEASGPRRACRCSRTEFHHVPINFVILALIIFIMVKQINRLKTRRAAKPPAAPPEEVLLLVKSGSLKR